MPLKTSASLFEEQLGPLVSRQDKEGVDIEDVKEMTTIVHAANGKPENKSRRNGAVPDMATVKRNGQDIFTRGAQGDRGSEK